MANLPSFSHSSRVPKKTSKFQQDFQGEENPEVLNQFLTESQIKETQNKQKLYQIRRENEALKEQLSELQAQTRRLEVSKDVNQKYFKKNESEIFSLKKPLEENFFLTDAINSTDSQESLRKKTKEILSENRKEVDQLFETLPEITVKDTLAEGTIGKLLDLLKGQIQIYKEDMLQKEKAYRHMQDKFVGEFEMFSEEHREMLLKIEELSQDKKADMLRKYALERRIAYLEADVELGNGYVNAQKLALSAAREVSQKIQKSDNTKSLSALSNKIQRKIASTKPI
jgi:hypothetical protein